MRILATRWFHRWSRRVRLSPPELRRLVADLGQGVAPSADLGGGLLKLRIARPGSGKRGGCRTIVAFQLGRRAVFLFGYAKNEKDTLTAQELKDWQHSGHALLQCAERELEQAIADGELVDMEIQS